MKILALLLVVSGIYFFGNSDLNAHENPASTNDVNPKQTETTIELEQGEHSLQLLLGNYLHIPHDKPVLSKKITITVE